MSRDREYEGKDLQEALQAAAKGSGIAEAELDYKIIEQGRRGLFGLGARNVRIRLMPPLKGLESEPSTKPARREKVQREQEPREKAPREQAPREKGPRERRRGRGGRGRRKPQGGERGRQGGERGRQGGERGRQGGERGRQGSQRRRRSRARREPTGAPATPENLASVQERVEQIFELMGLDLSVQAESDKAGMLLSFAGADSGSLAADKGELQDAIQFLLNRMSRRAWPGLGRIVISQDGQKRPEDDDLIELVEEVAQQVANTGEAKRLHPMNAYERRLVHLTIRRTEGLGSRSEGSGHMKRVKIYPQGTGRKD